ncbi:MAG: RHS repeat-associated core domain-containing protein [Verrucomicrobiae bacterium]|nr:RHS repeat-associated core domain-containing protein [Verrucomicrobiae bacterium]
MTIRLHQKFCSAATFVALSVLSLLPCLASLPLNPDMAGRPTHDWIKRDPVWNPGGGGGWVATGETRNLYDGRRVVQEPNDANTPTVTYTRGPDLSGTLEGAGGIGGLLARSNGYNPANGSWSTHHYYHADGGGNITALLNNHATSAAVEATYRYDPYGRTLSQSGAMADANTYRFSSKPFHPAIGLYDYGFRFYDPMLQRWINRDPIGESLLILASQGNGSRAVPAELVIGSNLFQFTGSDPVNHVDTDGRIIVPTLIVGAAILTGWGLWELADAIRNAQRSAENASQNRERQNDAIADPLTAYCPTKNQAVANGLGDMAPDIYRMATGPGTLAGGPPGSASAGEAGVTIIWTGTRPEPEDKK